MRLFSRILIFTSFVLFIISCKPVPVSHWFPVTPQEFYEKDLLKEKLEKTAAGQTWFNAGKSVFNDSLFSVAPYQERFFLGDSTPAQAIRLKIPEGRSLVISTTRNEGDTTSRLFLELYRIKTNGKPQRVEYLKAGTENIFYENKGDDTLLLRLQTGLNERLVVAISLKTRPTLSFPVAGHGMNSVISAWGAERDGGSRSHEGIDIKAKRGTPVVASTGGYVTQTGTNNLGGKVVFLSADSSPYALYYAHLDSQLVSSGTRVVRGDTLGLVGNTGNAITTSPHLHFGVYARGSGAVNPLPFINDRTEKLPGLPETSKWLGNWVRIRRKTTLFSSASFDNRDKIETLNADTRLKITGEMAKGYRVETLNGTRGYIPTVPLAQAANERTAGSSL